MNRNGPLALLFHLVFVAFILAPLVMVCIMAFTPEGFLRFPYQGFSLRWFIALRDDTRFVAAFWTSVYLAVAAASVATVLTIPAALAIARYSFRGRSGLLAFFLSPLMIPQVVLGVALLRFLTQAHVNGTFAGLLLSHVMVVMPFCMRLTLASLTGLERSTERAALSLGASEWTAFRRVTLPLILPGVAGGWLLAFIQSFDEVTMTVFIASPSTTTLPVALFNYVAESIDPLVASVSTAVMAITLLFMLIIDRLYGIDRLLVGR